MPRIIKTPVVESNPDFALTMKLLNEYRALWTSQLKASGVDPVKFSRLSLVALTQIASMLAVDIKMAPEQFVAVCRANFQQAYDRAPKFGE